MVACPGARHFVCMDPFELLEEFCRGYGEGYELRLTPKPEAEPGAVGMRGASPYAQLCRDRVVAIVDPFDSVHSLAHEVGHDMVAARHGQEKFDDEQLVAVEQIAFLDELVRFLLAKATL